MANPFKELIPHCRKHQLILDMGTGCPRCASEAANVRKDTKSEFELAVAWIKQYWPDRADELLPDAIYLAHYAKFRSAHVLEEAKNDPANTLFGLDLPTVRKAVLEYQERREMKGE